jgi:hypothetical protein
MSKGLNHWHMTWQFTSGTAPFTWLAYLLVALCRH